MKRALTAISVLALGGVAYGMYQLAYEVKRLEDELIALNRSIAQEREAADVMKAEWTYLTRPDRLQARVDRHLVLEAVPPHRMLTLAELPRRPETAVVEGWGIIAVPDPNLPPPPQAKPAPEHLPTPTIEPPVGALAAAIPAPQARAR